MAGTAYAASTGGTAAPMMWPRTFLAAVQVYCCTAGTDHLTVPVTRFDDRGRAAVAGTAYAASTGGTTALWCGRAPFWQQYNCTAALLCTSHAERRLMTLLIQVFLRHGAALGA